MAKTDIDNQLGFSLDELWRIVWRRKWWLVVPAVVGMTVAGAFALLLPPIYEAESKILIEQPEVDLERRVVGTQERGYESIKRMILSRENLGKIIEEFGLYKDMTLPLSEKAVVLAENIVIERLPSEIEDPRRPKQVDAFRIAYRSKRSQIVPRVANRLADMFRTEHLRMRSKEAQAGVEFFKAQIEQKQAELGGVSGELALYREGHLGEMPEALSSNERILDRLNQELRLKQGALSTAQSQVHMIRQQLRTAQTDGKTERDDPYLRKTTIELTLNNEIAAGKTEKHPDVIALRAELVELGKMLENRDDSDRPTSPATAALERELRNYVVEVEVYQHDIETVNAAILQYEERIANTPAHTAVVTSLIKRYEHLQEAVRTVQLRLNEAELKHKMETRELGERFRIFESAVVPESPVSPNRPLWFVVGTVLGVLMGLLLLIVRESADTSFHTAHDLQEALDLPVLASVPLIETARARKGAGAGLKRWAGRAAIVVLLLAGAAAAVIYLNDGVEIDLRNVMPEAKGELKSDV